ncbi:DUF4365 domain-containing protein [Thalassorhabdus alkalitolerans]|uniref:DUF4365 domain-containing protein n=1 Tax=Thalassorhabdus alkalitolerans TaxID=2282697 RepID=A0ABW0YHX7_9BACI
MDQKKIEQIGIVAVEDLISESEYLYSNLEKNDKDISFDGSIDVFSTVKPTVKSIIGSVPVQVKGTTQRFKGDAKFPLEKEHYEYFYKCNGVLFFVVKINKKNHKTKRKVFFKILLGKELHSILQSFKEGQKTKRLKLKPINNYDLTSICKRFIREREHQTTRIIEDALKDHEYERFVLSSPTFDKAQKKLKLFDHEFYLYGIKKGSDLKYPLHHIKEIDEVSKKFNGKIILDGRKVHSLYQEISINKDSEWKIIIENTLELNFYGDGISYKIIDSYSVESLSKVIQFLLNFNESEKLKVLDEKGRALLEDVFYYKEDKLQRKETLKELEVFERDVNKIKQALKILEVDEHTPIGNTEKNPIFKLLALANALLENEIDNISMNNKDSIHFGKLSVGDLCFALFYDPSLPNKLMHAFSPEAEKTVVTLVVQDTGEKFDHSPYILLSKNILTEANNLNYEVLKRSFASIKNLNNPIVFEDLNSFCLRCLHAYDQNQQSQLLELVEHIYNKFLEQYKSQVSDCYPTASINLMQTLYRKQNRLTDAQIDMLIDLSTEHSNNQVNFCVNVLTENKRVATSYFERLDKETQHFYKTLPIFNIYEALQS